MQNYKMWIGGKWVEAASGKTYKVFNPATEEEIAQVPLGDKEDVDKAVKAARKAFQVWSKVPVAERSKILMKIAETTRQHKEDLAQIDMLDHGSPITLARSFADTTPPHFQSAASIAGVIMDVCESRPSDSKFVPYLRREPIGVCAGIIPWNVPLAVAAKIAAALATGNAIIIKPPTVDALTPIKLAEILEQSDLPAGIVNIVTGPGNTVGETLASHPGIDMVAFTGSCETGKSIMAAASKTTKRLFLELGGKNPFIVMSDANLDAAADTAARVQCFNTGMICGSPGRYYVHQKVHDEFVDKLTARLKRVVVGAPSDEKTEMGPTVSAEHRDRVEKYMKLGIEEGATLVLGGKRPDKAPLNKGYYLMPAIFSGVTQNMRIAREEIFGPVACVLKYKDEDDIVKLANDTTFGLSASIWTQNLAKAQMMANEIQAGTVWINSHMESAGGATGMPWGGFKESGFGKEDSMQGIQEYTQIKVISFKLI